MVYIDLTAQGLNSPTLIRRGSPSAVKSIYIYAITKTFRVISGLKRVAKPSHVSINCHIMVCSP